MPLLYRPYVFFKVHLIHYLPFVLVFLKSGFFFIFFIFFFYFFFYLKLVFLFIAIEEAQLKGKKADHVT